MNTKNNLGFARTAQTILIVFMVCVTVVASTNTYANAQGGGESNSLTNEVTQGAINVVPFVPGGPGFIMISAFDFTPILPSSQWAYYNGGLYNPSSDNTSLKVGLTLPHDATINKVTIYFQDNSDSDLSLFLIRTSGENNQDLLTHFFPTGNITGFRYMSSTYLDYEIVDNQSYAYYLLVQFPANSGSNLKLVNVRIDYEYTVYTPAIMK